MMIERRNISASANAYRRTTRGMDTTEMTWER